MERDLMLEEIYEKYKNPITLPSDGETLKDEYDGFEAIMGEDGQLYAIPNGHQIGLVCIYADQMDLKRYDVAYGTVFKNLSFFFEEMLKETKVALLHAQSVQVNKLTEKQKEKIKGLQEENVMARRIVISELNYNGVHNESVVYEQKRTE